MKTGVKIRTIVNLFAIGLCLVLIYIFLGSPVLTEEAAYRRAEKANLVGPGEILAVIAPEGQVYSHLILAKDETGVMLYAWDWWNREEREFVYREAEGDMTLAAAPGREYFWLQSHGVLPVYLFDSCSEAVRAELTLTIRGEFEGEAYENTYSLTAEREEAGFFAFTILADDCQGPEGHGLFQLRCATGNSAADLSGTEIQADVRLYDAQDREILQKMLALS